MKGKCVVIMMIISMGLGLSGCSNSVSKSKIEKDLLNTECTSCVYDWTTPYENTSIRKMEIDEIQIDKRLTEGNTDTVWVTVTTSNNLVKMVASYTLYYTKYTEGGWQLDDYQLINEAEFDLLNNLNQDELTMLLGYNGYGDFAETFSIIEQYYSEALHTSFYKFDVSGCYDNCDVSGEAIVSISIETSENTELSFIDEQLNLIPRCNGIVNLNTSGMTVDWSKMLDVWNLEKEVRGGKIQMLMEIHNVDIIQNDLFYEISEVLGEGSTVSADLEFARWDGEYLDMHFNGSGTWSCCQTFNNLLEPSLQFTIETIDDKGNTMSLIIEFNSNIATISQAVEGFHYSMRGNIWGNEITDEQLYRGTIS